MRRLLFIVLALLVLAAAEITLLILVGQAIGAGWTVLLVLGTSALGGFLLRREGARAWHAFRSDVREGRPPGNAATDGLLVFIGGVFMLVPGFMTDVIGALLLVPPIRRLGRAVGLRLFGRRLSAATLTSLFGPRRVRVHYGEPDSSAGRPHRDFSRPSGPSGPGAGASGHSRRTGDDSEAIEGEIIDPR